MTDLLDGAKALRGQRSVRACRELVVVLAAASVVLGGCGTAASTSQPEAAVVRLEVLACDGTHQLTATGVGIDETTIATVAHTFDDSRTLEVVDNTGQAHQADIVWLDVERDLALLRVRAALPSWLPLGQIEDGQDLTVITAASAEAFETKQATVVQHVDATLDGVGERAAIEIAANIVSGDSGAPALNSRNQVVGIVFATARRQDRGWVIAAEEIEAALAQPIGDPIPLGC